MCTGVRMSQDISIFSTNTDLFYTLSYSLSRHRKSLCIPLFRFISLGEDLVVSPHKMGFALFQGDCLPVLLGFPRPGYGTIPTF